MAEARRTLTDDAALPGVRVLLVEGRFYEHINDELIAGAKAAVEAAGGSCDVVTVLGCLEVPVAISIALDGAQASGKPYDGAVALGCVIRGETIHYEIVSGESARALMDLTITRNWALGNGILTVENEAQALARARVAEMDKGGDAARACLALVRLKRAAATGERKPVGFLS